MAENIKQSRFVREYAVDCNGAAAAVRAGYAPRSAKVTASRLLRMVCKTCGADRQM